LIAWETSEVGERGCRVQQAEPPSRLGCEAFKTAHASTLEKGGVVFVFKALNHRDMIAILRIPSNIKESAIIKAAGGVAFRSE
jgi:hypothetical protein